MSQTRRLAAILAADVVGYSRLVEADEEGTLAQLRTIVGLAEIMTWAPVVSAQPRSNGCPSLRA